MIDNEDNKVVRYSDFNNVHCSQFKEFNCEQELTPIQSRLYYLMIFGKQPRAENESLYGWTNRLGLPKSTTYGLFTKRNQNMHLSLATKLAEATGANIDWIQKGIGEPFEQQTTKLLEEIKPLDTVSQDHNDDRVEIGKLTKKNDYINSEGMSLHYLRETVRIHRDICSSARSSERGEFENGEMFLHIYEYLVGKTENRLRYPIEIAFVIVEKALKKISDDKTKLSNRWMAMIISSVAESLPHKISVFSNRFSSYGNKSHHFYMDIHETRNFIRNEWSDELFQYEVINNLIEETLNYYEYLTNEK